MLAIATRLREDIAKRTERHGQPEGVRLEQDEIARTHAPLADIETGEQQQRHEAEPYHAELQRGHERERTVHAGRRVPFRTEGSAGMPQLAVERAVQHHAAGVAHDIADGARDMRCRRIRRIGVNAVTPGAEPGRGEETHQRQRQDQDITGPDQAGDHHETGEGLEHHWPEPPDQPLDDQRQAIRQALQHAGNAATAAVARRGDLGQGRGERADGVMPRQRIDHFRGARQPRGFEDRCACPASHEQHHGDEQIQARSEEAASMSIRSLRA
ncbi:hypothetical protein [Novosphingobium panipatense]|uniref:hypothetical protein n=1 Tax=Novosphingobium panipatense TaxID=428991 RepID=UPI0036131F98